ncbi:MAG TPA: hypothetical protein VGM87_07775 [Roseomonas sp.]
MASLTGTGALMLWLDVAPALRAETDTWYAREHLPDRTGAGGYRCARRYRAIAGAPEYLTFFVAPAPEDLASPGYLGLVRQVSPQSRRIRAGFQRVVRNTFRCEASHSLGTGGIAATLRLTPREMSAAQRDWLARDLLPRLAAAQGIVAVHLLLPAPEIRRRMDAVRVTGLDDAWTGAVLMLEALQDTDLIALREGPLALDRLEAHGIGEEAYGVYRLQHEVTA